MGLSLTLLPIDGRSADYEFVAFSRLETDRDYDLYRMIKMAKAVSLAAGQYVKGYMGDNFGKRNDDPYGTILTLVEVQDLVAWIDDYLEAEPGALSELNSAIHAFLKVLRPSTLICLYWH